MIKKDYSNFEVKLNNTAYQVNEELEKLLESQMNNDSELPDAMRYAVLSGGKRLRPFIVVESGGLFDVSGCHCMRAAAAVEMVHAYSLVHDDLPCMDDDEFRRGQLTVHAKYGEATAVLVGDALLTLAFEILAHENTSSESKVCLDLVSALSKAAGANGMVGGQILDIKADQGKLDSSQIAHMQSLKTAQLIAVSGEMGAIIGKANHVQRSHVRKFAHDLGLAFQIKDDLLDVEGFAAQTGKAVGKDAVAGKATLVDVLGPDGARQSAIDFSERAKSHLDIFGDRAKSLRELCDFVITRES